MAAVADKDDLEPVDEVTAAAQLSADIKHVQATAASAQVRWQRRMLRCGEVTALPGAEPSGG